MALTPVLTATPSAPPTYNVGMAETFSWVPVEGANRPLYARATYLANASDISVSLSAGSISLNLDTVEQGIATNNALLTNLTASNIRVPGFDIPTYDEIDINYVGSTNNINDVTYKNSSTAVLSLSFVYTPNPPTLDNALLVKVKKL